MTASSAAEHRLDVATAALFARFGNATGKRGWADQNPAMENAAVSKRLIDLSASEYEHLSWHALCFAKADGETVRFFLPRLLSDIALGCDSPVPPEFVIDALRASHWRDWDSSDTDAVEQWFAAWWEAVLTFEVTPVETWDWPTYSFPAGRRAGDALKLIAYSGLDIHPLLKKWIGLENEGAAVQLAKFITDYEFNLRSDRLESWDKVWSAGVDSFTARRMIDWLTEPTRVAYLEMNFWKYDTSPAAVIISHAIGVLRQMAEQGDSLPRLRLRKHLGIDDRSDIERSVAVEDVAGDTAAEKVYQTRTA